MIRQVEFKPDHIKRLLDEPQVAYIKPYITEDMINAIANAPYVSSIEVDGDVVLAGGVSMYWHGRGEAWAFYDSKMSKHAYIGVHNIMYKWFDLCPVRRIEAAIAIDDIIGHRRTLMLGFKLEAERLEKFRPDGVDCALYARIKQWQ